MPSMIMTRCQRKAIHKIPKKVMSHPLEQCQQHGDLYTSITLTRVYGGKHGYTVCNNVHLSQFSTPAVDNHFHNMIFLQLYCEDQ